MKKKILTLSFVLALTFGTITTAYAADYTQGSWEQQVDTTWKYKDIAGAYMVNSWILHTDNCWYYIGADGVMLTNTTTPDGCYVDVNGVWVEVNDNQQNQSENGGEVNTTPNDEYMSENEKAYWKWKAENPDFDYGGNRYHAPIF